MLVNITFTLGGMMVHVPIPVPLQLAPDISITSGMVMLTVPEGDMAGSV